MMGTRTLGLSFAALMLGISACTPAPTAVQVSAKPPGQEQQQPSAAPGGAPDAATLVTVADVEKVTGMTGVKVVAKGSTSGAVGDLDYAGADGKFLLWVNAKGADYYDTMDQAGVTEQVSGIGDAAFIAPKTVPKAVMFKKGATAVYINTKVTSDGKGGVAPVVTIDKLKELAGIAASRL